MPERSLEFEALVAAYNSTCTPLEVSYRKLAGGLGGGERLTHLMHKYPAKLLPHIPYYFLSNISRREKVRKVLDPFSGSGTVGVEAASQGIDIILRDSNPLACLLARVKTRRIEDSLAIKYLEEINVAVSSKISIYEERPKVVNRDYWFDEDVQVALDKIRLAISSIECSEEYKDFFRLCFSSCVYVVSKTDKRLLVPVRPRGQLSSISHDQVISEFNEISNKNIVRIKRIKNIDKFGSSKVLQSDCRKIDSRISDSEVDLIITSPPYGGAQKYVRSSSLSLGWLGYAEEGQLRPIEKLTIGREHLTESERTIEGIPDVEGMRSQLDSVFQVNPSRGSIMATYFKDMNESLIEMWRVLGDGGSLILVMGDNTVAGSPFPTTRFVVDIAKSIGFQVVLHTCDKIISRSFMTRRKGCDQVIAHENVVWLKKNG